MDFVRVDATVIVDNRVSLPNIDYFTLMREVGAWKFLSASYVAKTVSRD